MEYDFRRNNLTGTLVANFSMDHEILGFWFVEELGEDKAKISQIETAIDKLQQGVIQTWLLTGRGVSVAIDQEQVRVFANELDIEQEYEFDEAFSLYNGESEAFCGLEDFLYALQSWQDFISDS
ncbi:YacL family protein [Shewanella waksmanii]|uniref:YacL family protein n=1 Tax=Shewanella waksmanii TaxID=213783 RepID=UPI003734CD8F